MRWQNTETPTFAGVARTRAQGPAVAETMVLYDRDGNVVATFAKDAAGVYTLVMGGQVTQTAPPLLTASTGLRVARARYSFATDGGAVSTITPVDSDTIPVNAILVGGTVNVQTAALSSGSATVAVGTSAGSSASSILAATAKASLTLAALINAVPVFATPVKLSVAGQITFTIATAALTAGVIEVWVFYVVAAA